jgi:hypothetical protein
MEALRRRARKLEAEFVEYWKGTFDSEGQERLWLRYLARRAPVRRAAA